MEVGGQTRRAAALVVAAGLISALVFTHWGGTLIASTDALADENGIVFVESWTDDPPDSLDPGHLKDVAWSEARSDPDEHGRRETVIARVHNAYPSYTTQVGFTLRNKGTSYERIVAMNVTAPAELGVRVSPDVAGLILGPGRSAVGTVAVRVGSGASQGSSYPLTVAFHLATAENGTIGFWRAWDRHNAFSRDQIISWLVEIDSASHWLGPTTLVGMQATLRSAAGGSARERFLGHYLATRLNLRSGLLPYSGIHDVTGVDPGNYLSLSDPAKASLHEIITAVESKYGAQLTRAQYLCLKDVCDALNNREM